MRPSRRLLAGVGVLPSEAVFTALQAFSLTADCSEESVRRRFRRLCFTAHPDRGGSRDQFMAVKGHYDVLMKWKITPVDRPPEDPSTVLRELEAAVRLHAAGAYRDLYARCLSSEGLLESLKLLFLIIEGSVLAFPLGHHHIDGCLHAIRKREEITMLRANVELFNAVLAPYVNHDKLHYVVEEEVLVVKCITLLVEEMQSRDINLQDEWWTMQLIGKSLRSGTKLTKLRA